MNLDLLSAAAPFRHALWLQLVVFVGLVGLCVALDFRYGRRYFALWAIGWGALAAAVGSMIGFLSSGTQLWLFWSLVFEGWGSLSILGAAFSFAQQNDPRKVYRLLVFFPVVWSFAAVYLMADPYVAAAPGIVFLAATKGFAAWTLLGFDRSLRSVAARFIAVVLAVWAVHHLAYPLWRGQGAGLPWDSYLDTLLALLVALGIVLLVVEDLQRGLNTLTALSGELQSGPRRGEPTADAILRRALSLRGVQGSALWLSTPEGGGFVQGAGVAALWPFEPPPAAALEGVRLVEAEEVPVVVGGRTTREVDESAYTAALPVVGEDGVVGAIVAVGETRDPFTVLDNRLLLAFGQQVGAALSNEELHEDLKARTADLERLQMRMVQQHEDERARIWRELHDETAQVLAALSLQLGVIAEHTDSTVEPDLDRARRLLGEGIGSIRRVTRDLRPSVLDDLGVLGAIRGLTRDYEETGQLSVTFDVVGTDRGALSPEGESALYRTAQEGLANAVRHGGGGAIGVELSFDKTTASVTVTDDGSGFPPDVEDRLRERGGLAGLRERVTQAGGALTISNRDEGGATLAAVVPLGGGDPVGAVGPSGE